VEVKAKVFPLHYPFPGRLRLFSPHNLTRFPSDNASLEAGSPRMKDLPLFLIFFHDVSTNPQPSGNLLFRFWDAIPPPRFSYNSSFFVWYSCGAYFLHFFFFSPGFPTTASAGFSSIGGDIMSFINRFFDPFSRRAGFFSQFGIDLSAFRTFLHPQRFVSGAVPSLPSSPFFPSFRGSPNGNRVVFHSHFPPPTQRSISTNPTVIIFWEIGSFPSFYSFCSSCTRVAPPSISFYRPGRNVSYSLFFLSFVVCLSLIVSQIILALLPMDACVLYICILTGSPPLTPFVCIPLPLLHSPAVLFFFFVGLSDRLCEPPTFSLSCLPFS